MAGVEGEEWVDLFLHVSTRDGSAARPLRLIPSWESAPRPRPRPEGALELVASGDDAASVSASEGSGLCVGQTLEEVNNLTLNIDKCGESICSVPLVRCNSQLECENLGSIQGRTYINLEVYPGDGRSIIRLYELGAGTKVCWKSSAVFFIHPMCLADSETNATPENDLANANSPEHLSEKNPIHFHGKECGDMCFPPLRMNFMKDFTRNKMIGQGNEGKVYMCLSKFRPHCSAIKKTEQSSLFARSNHQEPREVSILARLRHGHIIDLYQAWSEEQRSKRFMCVGPCVFVSLKLCHRSLTKYLDQRPELNSESNSCVFKQILRGLAYMHSMGVAHRDIKPDNILIEPDLSIKIADFGIAKVTQLPMNHDSDCEGFGSFPYCAPEMSDPSIRHDEKVDIFSAGMIYCELFLLCGVERRRDTLKELRKKVTTHGQKLERDLLGESFDLDDALKGSCLLENWTGDWAILKRMLSPKASDRFSASELLKMFDDRFPDDKNVSAGV